MVTLNYDCMDALCKILYEEQNGCNLLYTCTLLNRQWENVATPYLYKDPWKYWLYQNKADDVAKQLIDTYMLCHNYHEFKLSRASSSNVEEEEEETSPKRIAIENHRDDTELPLYNYISFTRNLHIPSLFQCIKYWYESSPDYDENNTQPVYSYFLKIFELFVKEARIKDCTFADSIDDDSFPVTSEHLHQLVNCSNKVNLKYLNLGFFQCDSDGLKRITEKCNNLKTFKISLEKCSDETLAKFIKSQNRLTKLKIRNAKKIDSTLEALQSQSTSLVKLRILNSSLEGCQKPFNGIASCSNLRSIYFRKISWPADISISALLMPIAKQCEFHNVDFTNTYLPADVLVEIAKNSSTTLRKVHLLGVENQTNQDMFDLSSGIKALADHCKNIVHFEREIIPREYKSMIYFIGTIGKSLVRLEIESKLMKDFDDASELINSISHCSELEILNIGFFRFNSSSFKNLFQRCISLTELSICNSTSVDDNILKIIRENHIGKLKSLYIYACDKVTRDAVDQLRDETGIDIDIGNDDYDDDE